MSFSSSALDEKLINLVKQYPILYDYYDPCYMNFNEREVVWHKIGDALKRTALECKARWINIRDINRRILRAVIKHPSGSRRLYKYYKQLEFMKPFYRDAAIQNFDENNIDDYVSESPSETEEAEQEADPLVDSRGPASDDESPVEEIPQKTVKATKRNVVQPEVTKKKQKREIETLKPTPSTSNDPNIIKDLDPADTLDAFLLSIGATMKKFTPYHLNLAKSKIFNIVQQHELQQIMTMKEQSVRVKSEEK